MSIRSHRLILTILISAVLFVGKSGAQPGGTPQNFDLDSQGREPIQVFDNLYFVGVEFVASFLLSTSDGLILIDTLFDMPGYEDYLFNNIRKLGFDPADLKYVIITHGHRDHYGLGRALQDSTDAVIGTSAADWELIESDLGDNAPSRDWVIEQNDILTLGDTTLHFDITPGHTPGVVSMEFDVIDGEARHKVYFHGGPAPRTNERAGLQEFIDGLEHAMAIENIEVRITNHPFIDDFFTRVEPLQSRNVNDPHPFVQPGEFYEWAEGMIEQTREQMD